MLQGKTALVTGGSRGIGRAIVTQFAQQGADVAFTFLSSAEKAQALEAELHAATGRKIKGYASDAASFQAAEQLVQQVLADFGQIDILVNNAGITRDNLLLRISEEQFDEVIQANLKSVFNLTKHCTRQFLKQRAGSIINLTSVVGIRGQAGQSNYAASKAGIIGFTKSIAEELGSRNIRCNAISPGFIETDMTHVLDDSTKASYQSQIPLQRMGAADEVANTAVFLGSSLSSYITGQVISVCGGMCR
ncbi:MAG: 3-oxoacyl-[acyl-carrier-protein] reductase [Chitinophagales bacterium]